MGFQHNAQRLKQHLEILSTYGKLGETGVCRPTLSHIEREAFDQVMTWMQDAGMDTRIDDCGNLIGRRQGKQEGPILMIGSHIDSQPYGGRFDGTAGVLAGIEVVHTLTEAGETPDVPIEVVSFCDEEGWRFNKGLFGSRGIIGRIEPGELQRTDPDGVTREQALRDFGCDPDGIPNCVYPPGAIGAYLEMHIEQGPVLESMHQPIGIVTGISGPLWLTVTMKGFAGHAGSVPMELRKDALLGAASVITRINDMVRRVKDIPTVATVGNVVLFPNSRNIIPETVKFTVDLRDIDLERRNGFEQELRSAIAESAEKYGLNHEIQEDTNSEPRYCAEWVKAIMREESRGLGSSCPELMSGPFHDALMLSYVCDYGMIFVRCKGGISHNPQEFANEGDLSMGTELLLRTTRRIAKRLAEE